MNRLGSIWSAGAGLLRAAVPGTQRDLVRLRLQRFGRKNLPFYRIVAADSRSPRDGKCLEYLGTYNPIPNQWGEKVVTLNIERIKYWIVVGAQPTETIAKMLGGCGILPPLPMRHWQEPKTKKG
mmetsp:Transcript_27168/g.55387  ORF Transcript_27168/g.55387 Transcript_27168/m.55387 type:complete len:124 (-) Transcript_27168:105-476(-)